MHTTLNRIRECSPCTDGWKKLLNHLGKTEPDDEPLHLLTILESNGFNDTLWCFRAVEGFEKEKLLLAITYAREVEHLMPDESKKALDVFERYANGLATEKEFEEATAAARAAWFAAADAWAADAADAATAAWAAARAAARAAAGAVADAARAADDAADAAVYAAAADADADAAACSIIKAKQETQLRELLEKTCTQP